MPTAEIFTRCKWPVSEARRRLLTNIIFLLALHATCLELDAPSAASPQEDRPNADWRTGVDLQRQLTTSASVHWSGDRTLRPAVLNLARSQGVSVFLDRRVNPDKNVEFSVAQSENQSLWALLQQLASYLEQGICRVGPTIYIGPARTARVLATVAALRSDENSQLPREIRQRLDRPTQLRWPELTTPRELIQQVCEAYGLRIEGLEQVPHDLWPAVDWPPMTFSEQMTLLLAGFDLTFSFRAGGASVQLLALPERAVIRREYAVRSNPARLATEIRRRLPDVTLAEQAGGLVAEATIEEHDLIRRLVSGRPTTANGGKPPLRGETRYSLTIKNDPVGGVAKALAENLGRQIRFDPRVTNKLYELVSFEVRDATLDQLLRALLDPVGLSYQIDEQTLTILPGESD